MDIKEYNSKVDEINADEKMTDRQKSFARLALQDTLIPILFSKAMAKQSKPSRIYMFGFVGYMKEDMAMEYRGIIPIDATDILRATEQFYKECDIQGFTDKHISFIYSEENG